MLKVMTKSGKSYVKLDGYNKKYRINGNENFDRAKGDNKWAVIKGTINKIEEQNKKSGTLKGFKRDDYAPDNLPEFIDVLDTELDEDDSYTRTCVLGYDLNYYNPVYTEEIVTWSECEFEIIDRDCEPVNLPSWCIIDWPANIEHYPEVQHKYPCYIDVNKFFNELAGEIKTICNNSNKILQFTDYLNIGLIHVDLLVDIPKSLQKKTKEEYYPNFNSKRTKTRDVIYTTKKIRILTLNGFYKNERTGDEVILIPVIQGDNFKDLQKKVEEFKKSVLSIIDVQKYQICENCKGKGIHHV